jgi:hypothetical protein
MLEMLKLAAIAALLAAPAVVHAQGVFNKAMPPLVLLGPSSAARLAARQAGRTES